MVQSDTSVQVTEKSMESGSTVAYYDELEEECFKSEEHAAVVSADGLWCPKVFDGWSCIEATPAGSVAHIPCPHFILGFQPERFGFRICLEDGTWFRHPITNRAWTNYTTCVDMEDLQMRMQINLVYKIGYTVSLVALLISMFIFFYFRSLACARTNVHKNLFASLAMNNLLWLVYYYAVIEDPVTAINNGVTCRLVHILTQYFMMATYSWMFCEGLYLHKLLVSTFLNESKLMPVLYIIGWGVPAILVTIYAAFRFAIPKENVRCWIPESSYSLMLSIPVCISMLVNIVFLVNIVRLMMTKLHVVDSVGPSQPPSDSNTAPTAHRSSAVSMSATGRKWMGVRATLILIPTLGLQFLISPVKPEEGSPWEPIYEFTSATIVSSQGLCVALLFCFLNRGVIDAVRKKWQQYRSINCPWTISSMIYSYWGESSTESSYALSHSHSVFKKV